MAKPRRKQEYTPALLENLRYRFEQTEESVVDIARSVLKSHTTLRTLARDLGWTKYQPPPLDLTPAARLAAEAGKFAAEAGWGASVEIEKTDAASSAQPSTPDPSPPLTAFAGGGEKKAASPSDLPFADRGEEARAALTGEEEADAAFPDLSNLAPDARMARRSAMVRLLDLQIAKLHQRQAFPQSEHEMKEINAELNKLVAAHSHIEHALGVMQLGRPAESPRNDDDDIPEDIDAFRLDLARRIKEFVRSRAGGGDAAADRADPPMEELS
ncbi:MAG TPA: hypothetical protein VIJ67_00790 [Pseudolabrys sp.]